MTKILGLSGKKQSGKSSASNFLCASEMLHRGLISFYNINEAGKITVPVSQNGEVLKDDNGDIVTGVMELQSNNVYLNEWLETNVFPYVMPCAFADTLKRDMCINILGLSWDQVYGTDEQKNTVTKFQYPVGHDKQGQYMTSRQVMQFMGTDVMRAFYNDVWVDATLAHIEREEPDLAVIADVRFPGEVKAIKDAGGKVVRLTRCVTDDRDKSEIALDKDVYDWDNFDLVIDNQDMDLSDCHAILHKQMIEWKWVEYDFLEG